MSCVRNFNRGDPLLGVLGGMSICSKFVTMLFVAHISYIIRMTQKLAEFEIRRVQADVRTVTPGLIHRITPRFKSMLHELHAAGNLAHGMLAFFVPLTIACTIVLVGGAFIAVNSANAGAEGGGGDDDGYEISEDACVPIWVFAQVFQPMISLAIYIIA